MKQKVTTTVKLRLVLTDSDSQAMLAMAEQYRLACNRVSRFVFRSGLCPLREMHKWMYRHLREDYSLKSQMAQSAMKTVISAYRSIKSNERKWTLVNFSVPQCDMVWNRDWSIVGDKLSLNTLNGRIRVGFYKEGNDFVKMLADRDYKFGTARFVVDRNFRYFLHIPVTCEVDIPDNASITTVVGIDRGIRKVAMAYDGKKTVTYSGKLIRDKRARFAATRRGLQQRKTSSSRRRLKKIGHRENGWMRDVNHCIAKALVESSPKGTLFVLEDLKGIRGATEHVRTKNRYVTVSWSYYDLEQKLSYKASMTGQKVIKVDPSYTSQRCPICGKVDSHSRNKKKHYYCCTGCGYRSDDDRVGAMNLYQLGLEYLNGNESPCIQSPAGKPDGGGCCQSPCDVTPRRKANKGRRPNAVCTSGQLQAHGL